MPRKETVEKAEEDLHPRREFLAASAGLAGWAAATTVARRAFAARVPKVPQPGAPAPDDVQLPAGAVMPTRSWAGPVSASCWLGESLGLHEEERPRWPIIAPPDHGRHFMTTAGIYNAQSQVWMGHARRER